MKIIKLLPKSYIRTVKGNLYRQGQLGRFRARNAKRPPASQPVRDCLW